MLNVLGLIIPIVKDVRNITIYNIIMVKLNNAKAIVQVVNLKIILMLQIQFVLIVILLVPLVMENSILNVILLKLVII